MVLGEVPTDAFLAAHGLEIYRQVRSAVKAGRVGAFRAVLSRHKTRLASWGVLFALERLEAVAVRNLLRLVHQVEDSTRLPLSALEGALRVAGCAPQDCEPGQGACMVANLVELGMVRGYISHEHQKVVLSAKEAFPPLHSLLRRTK